MSTEWSNQQYPLADPVKPVWQWSGWPPPGNMWLGGKCKKVRIPTIQDQQAQLKIDYEKKLQDMRIAEINRGSWLFLIGSISAGIGFAMHFITAYPIAQRLSEWVFCGGLITAGIGLFIKKASEYQNWIALAIVAALLGFILYKCKNWSISHIFKDQP
jgi:hypothetical protein